MKILDLFCGAGGAAMGLYRAAHKVVGVDIEEQPNYPFTFIQADALTFDLDGYDAYWASPPCQCYSKAAIGSRNAGVIYPNLIPKTRERLLETGKVYVIENVVGSPLINPIYLEGTMFGLGVLRRRLFESNMWIPQPEYIKPKGRVQDGYYVTVAGEGGDSKHHNFSKLKNLSEDTTKLEVWRYAMGINWMTKRELTQAVPPAYAEYIGNYLFSQKG